MKIKLKIRKFSILIINSKYSLISVYKITILSQIAENPYVSHSICPMDFTHQGSHG